MYGTRVRTRRSGSYSKREDADARPARRGGGRAGSSPRRRTSDGCDRARRFGSARRHRPLGHRARLPPAILVRIADRSGSGSTPCTVRAGARGGFTFRFPWRRALLTRRSVMARASNGAGARCRTPWFVRECPPPAARQRPTAAGLGRLLVSRAASPSRGSRAPRRAPPRPRRRRGRRRVASAPTTPLPSRSRTPCRSR